MLISRLLDDGLIIQRNYIYKTVVYFKSVPQTFGVTKIDQISP